RAPQIVAEAPQGLLRVGAVAGAVAADVLVPAGADDVDEEVRDRPAVALVPLDHAVVGGRAGRVDLPAEAGAGHPVVVVDVGHRVERLPEVLLALGDVAGAADLEQEARCLEQRDGVVRAAVEVLATGALVEAGAAEGGGAVAAVAAEAVLPV